MAEEPFAKTHREALAANAQLASRAILLSNVGVSGGCASTSANSTLAATLTICLQQQDCMAFLSLFSPLFAFLCNAIYNKLIIKSERATRSSLLQN